MLVGNSAVHPTDLESVSTASPRLEDAAAFKSVDGESPSLEYFADPVEPSASGSDAAMEATKSKRLDEFMHARTKSRFLRSAVTLNNLSLLDENAQLCAVPARLGVPRRTLLSPPLWLGPHINAAVVVSGFLVMALVLIAPGAEVVEEHTACGSAGCTTPRFGFGLSLSLCLVGLSLCVLCACKMNRFIFKKACRTFDFWVIVLSWVTKELVQMRNLRQTFEEYGNDLEWQIMDTVTRCFLKLPIAICVGAVDSIQMPRSAKVVLASMVILTLLAQFSRHRFFAAEWADDKMETLSGDVSLRYVFLGCHLQISLFVAKVLVAYLQGKLYAFMRPWYQVQVDMPDKASWYAVDPPTPMASPKQKPPPRQRQSTFTTIVVNVVAQPDIEAQQGTTSWSFRTSVQGTTSVSG